MSVRQGFAWWCFGEKAERPDALIRAAADIGYRGVDFLPPELWPCARDAGLDIVTIDGHVPLEVGFNDRAQHAALADQVRRALATAAAERVPFVAVASGDRGAGTGGIAACVEGLAPLAAEAHEAGVVLVLEPLNSALDHAGHDCDRTDWAAAVVDRVGSPGLRILYDFYHSHMMGEDVLATFAREMPRIAHLHTAGAPGRGDLDDADEIDWPAVASLIRRSGYAGYVTHEFLPRGDPVAALRGAFGRFAAAADTRP